MSDDTQAWIPPAPSSDALKVAELCNVPGEARDMFCNRLGLLLTDVGMLTAIHTKPVRLRAKDITYHLKKVRNAANKLDKIIEGLERERHDSNKTLARTLLELELRDVELAEGPRHLASALSLQRDRMKALIATTEKAGSRASNHFAKEGRPSNPAFDWFVARLYEITHEAGGRWTHYRDRTSDEKVWRGALLPAMDIMRRWLPRQSFFPSGDLGYALERLSKPATTTPQKPTSKINKFSRRAR